MTDSEKPKGPASYFPSIEEKYGQPIAHWLDLLKYSERAELDPYNVSGKVSLALLEELMATASIIGRA